MMYENRPNLTSTRPKAQTLNDISGRVRALLGLALISYENSEISIWRENKRKQNLDRQTEREREISFIDRYDVWFASDPSFERGGEAVCSQGSCRDPIKESRPPRPRWTVTIQSDIRVRVHDTISGVPHARHLRNRPSHGARLRRALPQMVLLRPLRPLLRPRPKACPSGLSLSLHYFSFKWKDWIFLSRAQSFSMLVQKCAG